MGNIQPNHQLSSENQICEQFGVSRITVRRALQTLESEGLIYRRQGLGAFVADKRVPQGMVRLTSFVEDMEQAGLDCKIGDHLIRSSEFVRSRSPRSCRLSLGKRCVCLSDCRLGDGEPIAFDRTWLPVFYGQLLEGHKSRSGYDLSGP